MKYLIKCLLFMLIMLALFGMATVKVYADTPPKDMAIAIQEQLPLIREVMAELKVEDAEIAVPGEPIRSYYLTREAILKYTPSTKLSEILRETPKEDGAWRIPMLIRGESQAIVLMYYHSERGWTVASIGAGLAEGLQRLESSLPRQLETEGISGDYSRKWVLAAEGSELILLTCESGQELVAPMHTPRWWTGDLEAGKLYDVPMVMKEIVTAERSVIRLTPEGPGAYYAIQSSGSAIAEDDNFLERYRWHIVGTCLGVIILGLAIYQLRIKPQRGSL